MNAGRKGMKGEGYRLILIWLRKNTVGRRHKCRPSHQLYPKQEECEQNLQMTVVYQKSTSPHASQRVLYSYDAIQLNYYNNLKHKHF